MVLKRYSFYGKLVEVFGVDNIDIGMTATFSYCWNKNADSVLPVRALKSIFNALKAFFCGYSIDIASQENMSLMTRCGDSLFSCEVLRIRERRTTSITPSTLLSASNGIARDEKELLADKKEDENDVVAQLQKEKSHSQAEEHTSTEQIVNASELKVKGFMDSLKKEDKNDVVAQLQKEIIHSQTEEYTNTEQILDSPELKVKGFIDSLKKDDDGVHKENVQCDKPQNNDNFTESVCQTTTLVRDVILPKPPSVTTIDEAKKLLDEELDKQHKDIAALQIDSKYDHTVPETSFTNYHSKPGSRRKEFQADLDAQYNIFIKELEKCESPEDINNKFEESVLQMQELGIYRYWCLRQPAPGNPLPHYLGRVSIVNDGGRSCGGDAAILQLLHSGTMNYFIFRPIPVEKRSELDIENGRKNKNDHQEDWKRLHHEILFGSKDGGEIIVPYWIKNSFDGRPEHNPIANAYNGPLFDKDIVFKPQSILRRLVTPGANTPEKLRERILSDWRACRLHTSKWHYIALIRDKEGKITSIDGGRVGLRTFKSSQELLNKFMQGEKPYNDPSLIDIWE